MDPFILADAKHLQARYARSFARLTHYRVPQAYGTHAPLSLALPLHEAYRDAETLHIGQCMGFTTHVEDENEPWDSEGKPPAYVLCLLVRDASGRVRASLGMVGVDSRFDPYLTTLEAELYREAIAEIERENDALAEQGAIELSERATYAAGEVRA